MVKMLIYIALVAYFAGALGQFRSTYKCEDIEKALTEPVTLDQIAGTWHDVERATLTADQVACMEYTITNSTGADGKYKYKYVLSNAALGTVVEGTVTQETAAGRFSHNAYIPHYMVKTGADFTKHALMLTCVDTSMPTNSGGQKSLVYISMLSRTKTLSDEEKEIVKEKLKTITDLGNAKLRNTCPS